jgi:hypothetical protein
LAELLETPSSMRNTTAYHVHIATQDITDCVITAGLVKKIAIKLINLKIRISKRKISLITLERLLKKNVGTNEVETFSRRYSRGGNSWSTESQRERRRKRYVRWEMLERKSDAKLALQWSENKFHKCLKYWNARTLQYPALRIRIAEVMQWEVEYVWQEGMSVMRDKVQHLVRKWGKEKLSGYWKGVAIGDLELEEFKVTGQGTAASLGLELGSVTENPPVYGGVQLTDNQKALLTQCTPGFTTYERLDDIKMQHELEVMNVKIRREVKAREDRDGEHWTHEWQERELEAERVYDGENHVDCRSV